MFEPIVEGSEPIGRKFLNPFAQKMNPFWNCIKIGYLTQKSENGMFHFRIFLLRRVGRNHALPWVRTFSLLFGVAKKRPRGSVGKILRRLSAFRRPAEVLRSGNGRCPSPYSRRSSQKPHSLPTAYQI